MESRFTSFQQQAIDTDGQDICVAAGAGSGKTGVLVERFVRLLTQSKNGELPLAERAGVEEILVITFTEKATKEMKSRIVAELNRRNMVTERRQIETAYISTIHGFCSRLLQENPFEAGVDPQFKVLDEPQAKRLRRQVFEQVIAAAYDANDTEITELVAEAQGRRLYGDETGDPLNLLANAVDTVLGRMRGAGKRREELEYALLEGRDAMAARALEPVQALLAPLREDIEACLRSIVALKSGLMGTMAAASRTLDDHTPLFQSSDAPLPDVLAAMQAMQEAVTRARPRAASPLPQETKAYIYFQRIKLACEEAKELFGVVAAREETAKIACHRLWLLTLAVWKAFDTAKRRQGRLDNDDLQAEGVRLLETSPGVRSRYRRRFRHLMVDEFQDTSPLQMRLVELLHAPEFATGHPDEKPNRLFIVGDVQQSIYGFRDADSTLFRELERRFRTENAGKHVSLAVNFRSRPEILRLVAHVFQQVWREEQTPFVPLDPGAEFREKIGPSIEVLLTQDMWRKDYIRLEAEALAGRIRQLVEGRELTITHPFDPRCGQPIGYRDVAVLLRAFTDITIYEEAFARNGVPYYVVGGGRGYYARHEIRDLRNVLTVLDTPLDDVALLATLRSPFVGASMDTLYAFVRFARQEIEPKSDGEKPKRSDRPLYPALESWLESEETNAEDTTKITTFVALIETLRAQEDRLPVGHLLERLIAQTHYDARLLCRPGGRRRLANVRKLLQMANSDSVLGVREFIRRLRDLERLSEREGDAPTEEEAADVVRFLTIHGAKGLEFSVVFLADLAKGLLLPERGTFVCDPKHFALGTRIGGEPNLVYRAIVQRKGNAEKEEFARLLYVAMTRAKEHLFLCGNVGRNKGFNWADNLFSLLGILDAPSEPTVQILAGGLPARIAPLSYYAHQTAPPDLIPTLNTANAASRADRVMQAILRETPLAAALRSENG